MRVAINLASEPFRRDRPMLVTAALAIGVLSVVLIVLISSILSERERASSTRESTARLNSQIKALDTEQAKLEATLRRPGNAEVLERSVMLNTLIDRKSISWTRIFADLDRVMPHNVRLIYIRLPQVTASSQVTLDMVVGAQDPQSLQAFLKKLEESSLFGPPSVSTYLPPSQNEPLHRYRVNVNYAQKL